jgi:hypothetical protein
MADLKARQEAIRNASAHVRSGSIWLRRAVDKDNWKTIPASGASGGARPSEESRSSRRS